MSDLFKIMRLALYVIALPLAVTAVVSAESLFSVQEGIINESDFEVNAASTATSLDVTHGNVKHVLNIDQSGGVSGQIMSRGDSGFLGAAGMDVSLNRLGDVIASATTGDDGVFRFENVVPGPYTFIGTSPGNITTFGVYVFESTVVPSAGQIQFSVAATETNTAGVREILNSDVESVSYDYVPAEAEVFVVNQISQVHQEADGSISGRLAPLLWQDKGQVFDLTGTQVYLLNKGGVVANAAVNANGSYSLPNVDPGYYDFVAFGPHGAAAMAIEVTVHDPVAMHNRGTTTFASAAAAPKTLQGFDVVLGEPTSGTPFVDVEVIVDIPQQTAGFPGRSGGGGGGGYGGIGDFGGLIGAALAAWVITELIKNNNNQQPVVLPPVVLPPPTSPF